MYWTSHAETMDATPFLRAVIKVLPPYLDKQQIELYASLTEPMAQKSTVWLTRLTQDFKPVMPLSGFGSPVEDTQRWLEWMMQSQQQLWTQWADYYQQWQTVLAKEVNDVGEQYADTPVAANEPVAAVATETAELAEPTPAVATVAAEVAPAEATDEATVATAQEADNKAADDLTAIAGIGPALARKLNDAGIKTYADIAAWSEADIENIEHTLLGGRFAGRIQRDDWIGQARTLSKGA